MITVGRHVDSIRARRAQLVFKAPWLLKSRGPNQMDHVFGLGPRLEHERAGRIEDALDSEFALAHFSSSSIFSHLYYSLQG